MDSGGNAAGETENIITADESSTNVSKKVGRTDIQNNTLKESVEADTANADTEQIETAEEAESDSIEESDELPEILTDLAEPQLPDNAGSEPPVQDINVYSRNSEDELSEEEKSDIADLNIIMTDESSDTDFVRTYNRSIILKDNNSTEANLILNAAQSTVDAVNRYKEINGQASAEELKEIAAEQNRINMKQRADIMSSAGKCSGIVYEGAVPGADSIEYSVGGNFVKENIVIDSVKEIYTYRFK